MTAYVKDMLREATSIKQGLLAYTVFNDANYKDVIDLTRDELFRHIMISNTTDKGITLRFTSPEGVESTILIDSQEFAALDGFYYNGLIEAKREDTVTTGKLKVWCW